MKDVVMIGPYSKLEVDFIADHPGNTLFHCHQQLHMILVLCTFSNMHRQMV
jgi:FtsP/CotA-like multicopper oxidase with cupredoxin domain